MANQDQAIMQQLGPDAPLQLLQALRFACRLLVTSTVPALSAGALNPDTADTITAQHTELAMLDILKSAKGQAPQSAPEAPQEPEQAPSEEMGAEE